jgi:hypothetical protein
MLKKLILGIIFTLFVNINLFAEEYEEYEYINWKYLNFDLGYGSGGPGGALGFRYWYLGLAIGATGFANDIPLTANISQGQNINISELPSKRYPSNVVCGDLYAYYDFNTDYEMTAFVNVGFYSAIDSVLAYRDESGTTAYYRNGAVTTAGLTFGAGFQAPLTFLNEENRYLDQVIAGIGYHTKLGIYLRIAYRWE